jgi:ribosomal protein L11 methyltransferase
VKYIEIRVTVPEESREAVINRLAEMGSLGFEERDGDVIAYFEATRKTPDEICGEIERFRPLLGTAGLDASFAVTCSLLPDRDWNEDWKKTFAPIEVGEGLTIIPSWLVHETDRIPIIIDPGMVFGTGHHETTRTCLTLIERTAKKGARHRFLDIGTGTGILAVGAARLGFEEVVAVDIDPLAVDAARRNAEANNLGNILIREGTIVDAQGCFDVIVANLLSEILTGIANELAVRLNPGGTAILSGLLTGQEDGVIEAMFASGLSLREKVMDGKWISLVFVKDR